MTDEYVLQARELLAVELEKQYCPTTAGFYRKGDYDGNPDMRALVRVLREHAEKQPTFEQKVEAMKRTYLAIHRSCSDAIIEADRKQVREEAVREIIQHLIEDNGSCDCFAISVAECACGGWDDYKRKPLLDVADEIGRKFLSVKPEGRP